MVVTIISNGSNFIMTDTFGFLLQSHGKLTLKSNITSNCNHMKSENIYFEIGISEFILFEFI